jgi:hypothetical protein
VLQPRPRRRRARPELRVIAQRLAHGSEWQGGNRVVFDDEDVPWSGPLPPPSRAARHSPTPPSRRRKKPGRLRGKAIKTRLEISVERTPPRGSARPVL